MSKKLIIIGCIVSCMIVCLCGCSSSKSEVKDVEIKTGYTNCEWAKETVVSCGVEITNPNEKLYVKNADIRVTAYGETGNVLESGTCSITEIAPNTTEAASVNLWMGSQPSRVEFKLDSENVSYISENKASGKELKPLKVLNLSKIPDTSGSKITGEIQNDNDKSIYCLNTCVIFKDDNGNIKGGLTEQISPVAKNDKTPFSINAYLDEIVTDNYTVYPTIYIFSN